MFSTKRIPFCTVLLSVFTVCLTTLGAAFPRLFTLLAMWSQPEHWWQYASGIFLHGIEPAGFWAIHLGLNLLGLLPMGTLLERTYGTKAATLLFLAEWIVTAALFQLLHLGEHTYAVGMSTVAYAFAAGALPIILHRIRTDSRRKTRQPLFYYALFEYFGLLSMLNPANGVATLLLHVSGFLTGGLFALFQKLRLRRA